MVRISLKASTELEVNVEQAPRTARARPARSSKIKLAVAVTAFVLTAVGAWPVLREETVPWLRERIGIVDREERLIALRCPDMERRWLECRP